MCRKFIFSFFGNVQAPSDEIMYSCDEGFSWQSYNFGDNQLTVFGVITEPGEHTTVVR